MTNLLLSLATAVLPNDTRAYAVTFVREPAPALQVAPTFRAGPTDATILNHPSRWGGQEHRYRTIEGEPVAPGLRNRQEEIALRGEGGGECQDHRQGSRPRVRDPGGRIAAPHCAEYL